MKTQIIPANDGWICRRAHGKRTAKRVSLPHSVFEEPEVIAKPQIGSATYSYEFSAPEEWRERPVYFELGAAMQRAKCFINGKELFTHFGGYQRFFVPILENLRFGRKNRFVVELDNSPSGDMPPGKGVGSLDFCYHSGLHRGARIVVWNNLHISDELAVSIPAGGGIFVRTLRAADSEAEIEISTHVMNEVLPDSGLRLVTNEAARPAEAELSVEIFAQSAASGEEAIRVPTESATIPVNGDHTFVSRVKISAPQLWSPASPALYTARVTLRDVGEVVDVRDVSFGIRSIKIDKSGFYLNGERIFLRGTNRHSEYPYVGNALPPNAHRRDARLIKKAGFNFVRLSHYNQDPAFIEECDRLGIMLMPAIPGWQAWRPNEHFIHCALRDCRELVRSLRNHPSCVIWEVSLNESYPPSWANEQFHRAAHEEFPGEMCFTAGDTWGRYYGWDVLFPHDGVVPDFAREKATIAREYGDWGFGGNASTSRRSRADGIKGMLQQAWNFQWDFNRIMANHDGNVIGCCDWSFLDYNRGCRTNICHSGSLDIFRVPRVKFDFYRSQQSAEAFIAAYHDGKNKLVVFSNASEVEVGGKTQTPDSGADSPYSKKGSPGWDTAVTKGDATGGNPYDGGNALHLPHPPFTFTSIKPPTKENPIKVRGKWQNEEKALLLSGNKNAAEKVVVRTEGIEPSVGDLVFADVLTSAAEKCVSLKVSGAEIVGPRRVKSVAGIASFLLRVVEPRSFKVEISS